MKTSEIKVKVGDKVNLLHNGFKINSLTASGVFTVIAVGTKRIECENYKGEKRFFAYHDQNKVRTYKRGNKT